MKDNEAFKQLCKTYFKLMPAHYNCIDKTFAYTASGNCVQLYLIYHGLKALNNDPTITDQIRSQLRYQSEAPKPQKQARLNDEEDCPHQIYPVLIHSYKVEKEMDRLQLFVNMLFIVELCHRLSDNFQPTQSFKNNFVEPYVKRDETGLI